MWPAAAQVDSRYRTLSPFHKLPQEAVGLGTGGQCRGCRPHWAAVGLGSNPGFSACGLGVDCETESGFWVKPSSQVLTLPRGMWKLCVLSKDFPETIILG